PIAGNGFAYVPLGVGDIFAVRLVNDSDHDAAVRLTLDGLSLFAFSDHPSYRYVIVLSKGSALIKGWHRNNERSEEFRLTRYADGAGARKLRPPTDEVGTITAVFHAAWDPRVGPPADEGDLEARGDDVGVGRGRLIDTPAREVKRTLGRPRVTLNLR